MPGQPDRTIARNAPHVSPLNASTGPSGSFESRTPTTAPPWPTSAQFPLNVLCEDFRQFPAASTQPLLLLAEDFRHAATSAQLPLLKLWLLLRQLLTGNHLRPGH
jgi:hypothetical protein